MREALAAACVAVAIVVCTLPSDAVVSADRGLAIAYYPTIGELRIELNLRAAFGVRAVGDAAVRVVDERGAELGRAALEGGEVRAATLRLPDLPPGTYRALAEATGEGGKAKSFEQRFERRRFPWEGNDLGRGRDVFPPFEPVRVSSRAVEVVLRRYVMNGFGLWDGVTAAGHDLLAAPVTVGFETARGPGEWKELRAGFTSVERDRAVFEAENDGRVVRMRTRSTIDFDGCMRVELELLPGAAPGDLRALWIDVPVRDAEAPLWHLVRSGGIRFNPAGAAPSGSGLVWASAAADNGAMLGSFFPYVWLGGEERGIAFFADNDRGWAGGDSDSALELHREQGVLRLRLRLVRRALRVTEPIRVVFGLQASPTKPMPPDWQSRTDISVNAVTGAFWGMASTYADKYPAGDDFSIADAFVETRRTGRIDSSFVDRWIAQKYAGAEPALAANRRLAIERGFGYLAFVRDRPHVIYYDGSTQNLRSPEWAVFQDEWAALPFRARDSPAPIRTLAEGEEYKYLVTRGRSYQDFALWYAREWMARGFGIMVDNVFLGDCYDTVVCAAYRRPDGKVQPSAEIWTLREYFRRLWTLEHSMAAQSPFPLLLLAHMTNSLLLPVGSFAEIGVDNEWKRLEGIARFPQPPDLIRAEMLGRQVGAYPYAVSSLVGDPIWYPAHDEKADPAAAARLERTEWGMRMVHELARSPSVFDVTRRPGWPTPDRDLEAIVRGFRYGTPDVVVLNYWDEEARPGNPRVTVGHSDVKWLGLWKPATGEFLLVAVNWARVPAEANLEIEPPAGQAFGPLTDAENGAPAQSRGLVFQPGEVRLLRMAASRP